MKYFYTLNSNYEDEFFNDQRTKFRLFFVGRSKRSETIYSFENNFHRSIVIKCLVSVSITTDSSRLFHKDTRTLNIVCDGERRPWIAKGLETLTRGREKKKKEKEKKKVKTWKVGREKLRRGNCSRTRL